MGAAVAVTSPKPSISVATVDSWNACLAGWITAGVFIALRLVCAVMAFCPFLGLEQWVCQPKYEEYVSKQILVAPDAR
jgi:hypothetical protein